MTAVDQRATSSRGRKSFAQRLRGLWRRIEPGFTINPDAFHERWDSAGEGRATSIDFEGFGVTASLFIGRTPTFNPKDDQRGQQLTAWYAGERV